MTAPVRILYGLPPLDLHPRGPGEQQASPLVPGSVALETVAPGSVEEIVMLAPPGAVERRYALALALRALKPGGAFTAMAPKDMGGMRLRGELEAFGCAVEESFRRRHRICVTRPPETPTGLEAALAEGAPRLVPGLGLWSQPGVFSWDRIDPGTAALMAVLPPLAGRGADLGCGLGVLAHRVLASPAVAALTLVDIDRRAIETARRNVDDPRVRLLWADATTALEGVSDLDFVVMNPPFHDAGYETKGLGQRFIEAAHGLLRKGGALWMVANRHLPYEPVLEDRFARVERRDGEARGGGAYKVFEARR